MTAALKEKQTVLFTELTELEDQDEEGVLVLSLCLKFQHVKC